MSAPDAPFFILKHRSPDLRYHRAVTPHQLFPGYPVPCLNLLFQVVISIHFSDRDHLEAECRTDIHTPPAQDTEIAVKDRIDVTLITTPGLGSRIILSISDLYEGTIMPPLLPLCGRGLSPAQEIKVPEHLIFLRVTRGRPDPPFPDPDTDPPEGFIYRLFRFLTCGHCGNQQLGPIGHIAWGKDT